MIHASEGLNNSAVTILICKIAGITCGEINNMSNSFSLRIQYKSKNKGFKRFTAIPVDDK